MLGKRALFHHEFPRSAGLPVEFLVFQDQVRTDFFERGSKFGWPVFSSDVFHLFCFIYEAFKRFEPQFVSPFKCDYIVLKFVLQVEQFLFFVEL